MTLSPNHKRNLLTFWLCFTATVSRPTQLLRAALFPVVLALITVGFLLVLVYTLDIKLGEDARPTTRALLNAGHVSVDGSSR